MVVEETGFMVLMAASQRARFRSAAGVTRWSGTRKLLGRMSSTSTCRWRARLAITG